MTTSAASEAADAEISRQHFPATIPLPPPLDPPPSPRSQPDPRVHPVFAEASK